MVQRSIITPGLAAAFLCGSIAEYDSCNGTVADIGNGRCDAALNTPFCGYDGGDCCHCTCADGPVHSCSDNIFNRCLYPDCGESARLVSEDSPCVEDWKSDGLCDDVNNVFSCDYDGGDCCQCSCDDALQYDCGFDAQFACRDPACFESILVAEFPDCTGDWFLIGDGSCNAENNVAICGWDGGDCCPCDCRGAACAVSDFDCFDPAAGDELHDCKPTPPVALPCSADVQRTWLVDNSAQARALAAAVNCSGGSFEVEWRGHIVVDEAINVVDATVLAIRGTESGAVIDGNASTRLFTVVNAALHVSGVSITSGVSFVGGAIAAAASTLTLNRTSLVGNQAAGNAGAVYISDGTSLSCAEVSFVDNRADINGGAVYVTGNSVVSCGGSWLNNTAGRYGGALSVNDESSLSWREEAMFTNNRAGLIGGALFVFNSSRLSWSASSMFFANSAGAGGALSVGSDSSVSWNATTLFDSNNGGSSGGGLIVFDRSTACWSGSTTYTNNSADFGGALGVTDSNVSWTGEAHTVFDGNTAQFGGALELDISHLSCTENTTTSFTENSATIAGGALELDFGSTAILGGNVLFGTNSATGDPDVYESGYGGAVVVVQGSSVSWSRDLDFNGNSAEKVAGALYVSDSRVAWSGSTQFVGNHAALSGGALFLWNGSYVDWTGDTHFTSNEAGADGGAAGSPGFDSEFNFMSSTLVMNGSTAFVNNTSGANGGALALSEGLAVFIASANISFLENSADIAGGAIFVSGAGVGPVFSDISFVSNSAQVGGAVSTIGSGKLKGFADVESPNPTTFDRCRFINNRATATGGAIESASGHDSIVNSVFEGNKAGAGGALRLAGTASVEGCSFVDNASDGGGAAVSNIGSLSRMANISFSGNVFYCQPDMFLDFDPGDPYEAVCSGCQTSCDGCSFEEPDLVPMCEGVMPHSNSPGGTVTLEALSIVPGFWRATPSSTDILACYHADACRGGISGAADYCDRGYEGPCE